MPKPYVPTGRPPGRPKKPEVERQGIQDVRELLKDTTVDRSTRPLNAICPDCFPEGWPDCKASGVMSANCQHGVWVRRF